MWARTRTTSLLVPKLMRAQTTMAAAPKLRGKVAVVTASTDGIGLAIARRLGQDGAKVVVSSRQQKNVDKTVASFEKENIEVMGMVCHVSKEEDRIRLVNETVKKFGGIDILVSNAATNPYFGPVMNTTEAVWDKIMDTNVRASFFLCKEAVPHMEERGGGSIVVVSSVAGYNPMQLLGAYSISKTALLSMVKVMAPELATSNIRINGIAPGIIRTKFAKALTETEGIADKALEDIPMGRFGTPEDISGAASYLASDDSKYMTGETMLITGGMQSRL